MRSLRRSSLVLTLSLLAAAAALATGCSTTYPARLPLGERLPRVASETLAGDAIALPDDLAGSPAVLLIGYRQRAQFDLDRWWMGLLQAEVAAPVLEVPTIPALAPSFASDWIDDGMRSGIPTQAWGAVVTLYGAAAEPVARFTGNDRGHLARVLVLDAQGTVRGFADDGYSAARALELAALVRELAAER